MSVRPGENLVLRKGQKREVVTSATMFRQQPCQRAASEQTSQSMTQRLIHAVPILVLRCGNVATIMGGPFSGGLSIGIGPGQNLHNRERSFSQSSVAHDVLHSKPARCRPRGSSNFTKDIRADPA